MSVPAAVRAAARINRRSSDATSLFRSLLASPVPVRRSFLSSLDERELAQVLAVAAHEGGTPFALWRDDPVGFVQDVLRENTWSKPREILSALPFHGKVAVPSCFSSGKTWSASRALLWFAFTHPPGQVQVITMAPTWRQVARLLWTEVRFAHNRAGLPGTVDMVQMKIPMPDGHEEIVAYGLSGAPTNEHGVQGIHKQNLLLIVDEAGGISHIIGNNLRGMTSTEGSRMLAIGNPPTDEEGSWFEGLCSRPEEALCIPISAVDTPSMTLEDAPICRTCFGEADHRVTKHLVTKKFVTETIAEHGEDSNYVQAKVYARFPRGGPNRVLPSLWVDVAAEAPEPEGDTYVAISELGLAEETAPWKVPLGSWVRLGVDVAADGGDECVVARCVGDLVTVEHVSSNSVNVHGVDVAGMILAHIRKADALRQALGTYAPVHVKIDANGLGWTVADLLRAWGVDGLHQAKIIPVLVSESTNREVDGAMMRPWRKRDEMWLATRSLLQPDAEGRGQLRYRVDRRTLAQLRAPIMKTNSGGFTVVESKDKMKERGLSSGDRAEACLMAVYEPVLRPIKKKARLITPA